MQEGTIILYPGFLTKGKGGRILWHPVMPKFDELSDDWHDHRTVDVTNCVFDPWPYTSGGENCIMEILKN